MGDSPRDKAAKNVNSGLNRFGGMVKNQNFNVNNRFNGFNPQFDFNEMKGELDQVHNLGVADINRGFNDEVNQGGQALASSMASRGITGGSIMDNALLRNRNNANMNRANALTSLTKNRMNQNAGLMDKFNDMNFNTAAAAQNVDMQNMTNLFRKYGLMQNTLGMKMGNVQNMDDSTGFDDFLAILNTAANIGGAVAGGF